MLFPERDIIPDEWLVKKYATQDGQCTIEVDPNHLCDVMRILRDSSGSMYTVLIDICGVDYPEREKRFSVVYHLLSIRYNRRLRVVISIEEGGVAPGISSIYPTANWFEREVFDMYGVLFSNHPDLRRILTEYGFTWHPLRKDFPLSGFTEVHYDEERKCVVHKPVDMAQDYRTFDFQSPWEGLQELLNENDKS